MPDARVDGEWQVPVSAAVRWSTLTGSNQPEPDVGPHRVDGDSWPIEAS